MSDTTMASGQVGILGGTGPAGRGLALRLAACGHRVAIGSRDAERAERLAADLRADDRGAVSLDIVGCANAEAATCDVVLVATPWDATVTTVTTLADQLCDRPDDRLIVSMANAVAKRGDEFVAMIPSRGSVAVGVQAALPRARVAAAFHHLPARDLARIDERLEADVLVCADRADARDDALALIATVPGLRGLDCGSLANAGPVESFTAVLLTLNLRHRTRTAVRIANL